MRQDPAARGSEARLFRSSGSFFTSNSMSGRRRSGCISTRRRAGDHRRDRAFGGIFHRHRPARQRRRHRHQVHAVGPGHHLVHRSRPVAQRRHQVDGGDRRVTRPGGRPGAAIISGTRAEPSKKFILNHSPRSPSISPWSDRKTTIASCRVASSTDQDLADLVVDIGDIGEIAAAGAADMVGRDVKARASRRRPSGVANAGPCPHRDQGLGRFAFGAGPRRGPSICAGRRRGRADG
jgi:hypothetical protein